MSIAETLSTFTISPKGLPDGCGDLERVEIIKYISLREIILNESQQLKYGFCYKNHADIDLNTLFISLKAFHEEEHNEFFDFIVKGDTNEFFVSMSQNFDIFKKYAEIESIIIHEKTHYLDMTSTFYGLEYFTRKNNYYSVFNNIDDRNYKTYKEAFAISLYELQPLDSLKEILFYNWDDVKNYSFGLNDNEKFGVYLQFIVISNKEEINFFPLSMLMIIETRAFCVEYLNLFDKSKHLYGVNKIIYEGHIKKKFEEELNDCSMSEYNFLLKLAILEFDKFNINFKNTIEFVSYLLAWTLNLPFMTVTGMSSHIVRFFRPSDRRDALQMDLSRGMSRSIIPFVIIQSIPNYIINELPEFELLKSLIETSPKDAINFILNNFLHISDDVFQLEGIFNEKLKLVENIQSKSTNNFTNEIIKNGYENSILYEKNTFEVNFSDYYFLADVRNVDNPEWGEWIKYPKLCNINYEDAYLSSNTNYEQISMDTDLYKNFHRQHMFIQLAVETLDSLIFNKSARHAYIFD